MSTVNDLLAVDYGDDSSSVGASSAHDDDNSSSGEEEVTDIDKFGLSGEEGNSKLVSIDNEETEDDDNTVVEKDNPKPSDDFVQAPKKPQPVIVEDVVLTQRDWHSKFSKENPLYKRCKIRYSDHCYIKPRTAIPATGKPILYVAEGAENWTGSPNLLCAGQLVFCDEKSWVVIVVLWVGCVMRQRPNGIPSYSPVAKNMKVLLCPKDIFDATERDLSVLEGELRYESYLFVCLCFLFLIINMSIMYRIMSAFDLLSSLGCKIHKFMVLKRNKKAQQFFIELSIKYGAVSRFWNGIKVVQTVRAGLEKKRRQLRQNSARTIKRKLRSKKKTVSKPPPPKTPKESQFQQQMIGFMQQQMSAFQNALQKTINQALADARPPPQQYEKPVVKSPHVSRSSIADTLPLRSRSHSRSRDRSRSHSRSRSRTRRLRSDRNHDRSTTRTRTRRSRDRRDWCRSNRSRSRDRSTSRRYENHNSSQTLPNRVCYILPCPYPTFRPQMSSMYNFMNSDTNMMIPRN